MDRHAQLLAHARAPSSRKDDDDRAKAQLQAYLDIDSARTTRLPWPETVSITEAAVPSLGATATAVHASLDAALYLQDTQLAFSALQSQLFAPTPLPPRVSASTTSGTVKASSTRPAPTREPVQTNAACLRVDSPSPARAKDVELSQSSYLVSPFVTRPAKRQKANIDDSDLSIKRVKGDGQPISTIDGQSSDRVIPSTSIANINEEDAIGGTLATIETTSELPTSYSLSQTRSESSQHGSAGHHGLSSKEFIDRISQKTRRQAPNLVTSRAPVPMERDFTASPEKPIVKIHRDESQLLSSPSASAIVALQRLSTTIDPPEPEVGSGRFETHVTKALQRLEQNPDISKAYSPVSVTRKLQVLERGHWFVDCSAWTIQKQVDFWNYLETSICSGKLGWGIRCSRQTKSIRVRTDTGQSRSNDTAYEKEMKILPHTYSLGPIKVFCWGELVKHVYLLLYIASVGKIRKLGLQWRDAEGKVVVQMRTAA